MKRLENEDKASLKGLILDLLLEIVAIFLAASSVISLALLTSTFVGAYVLSSDGDDLGGGVVMTMVFSAALMILSLLIVHLKRFFSLLIYKIIHNE